MNGAEGGGRGSRNRMGGVGGGEGAGGGGRGEKGLRDGGSRKDRCSRRGCHGRILIKFYGGPSFLGGWGLGRAGRRGSSKEVRSSRRWHRRSVEGEDGRVKVLSGERVHVGVVGDMSENVGNMAPVDRRRWAGGWAGGRGGDSGRGRGEAWRRRNRRGRRGKRVAGNDGFCVVTVELGTEQLDVGNEITEIRNSHIGIDDPLGDEIVVDVGVGRISTW